MLNPELLMLARRRAFGKAAAVPPPGMDPAAMGGAPPGMGGAPPGMGGAPPGMDPAAMGGAPPPGMDPAAMGGAPPAPAPAPAPAPPMDPAMMAGGMPMPGMGPGGQKLKPEQMMQMLDFRLYNMQQQLTALLNHAGVKLEPGALVTPPGSPTPVAEAATPGGEMDPGPTAEAGGDAAGGSAIGSISPIQGASPEMAQKTAMVVFPDNNDAASIIASRYILDSFYSATRQA